MASRDLIFISHLVDCYKNSCLGVPLSVPAMTRPCVLCSHLAFPPQVAYTGLATLSFRKICFAIKTPDCALLTVMIALCVFFFFFFPGLKEKLPFTKGSARSLDAAAVPAALSPRSRAKWDSSKEKGTGSEDRTQGGLFESKGETNCC